MSEGLGLATALKDRRQDAEFRELLERLPAGAYTCDAAGLITFFNRNAVKLWGRTPALNQAGDRWCGSFRLYGSDGRPLQPEQSWMALALRENRTFNGREMVIERPDGSRRTVLAHASPMHDAAGVVVGGLNVLIDISDRKAAETQLREVDRNRTEFLATLAHELRNPLGALSNSMQILRAVPGDEASCAPARAIMERQLAQLTRLIDDLLDVSRVSSNRLELRTGRFDLGGLVAQLVQAMRATAERSGLKLDAQLPAEPLWLQGDAPRVAQALANLVGNACKFTPAGGRVQVSVQREGTRVRMSVLDNGIGLPADQLEHIFGMFTQLDPSLEREQGGLGIGLTMARRIAELHGGMLEARSAGPGQGSEFILTLPILAGTGPVAAATKHDDAAPAMQARRFLIVDDNRDLARSLATLLGMAGYEAQVVHDGEAALRSVPLWRPDVVLLDIGLPRLSGHDICRRLRQEPGGSELRIIAMTGWGQDQDRRGSEEAGFDAHLVKPVRFAGLMKLLEELDATRSKPALAG